MSAKASEIARRLVVLNAKADRILSAWQAANQHGVAADRVSASMEVLNIANGLTEYAISNSAREHIGNRLQVHAELRIRWLAARLACDKNAMRLVLLATWHDTGFDPDSHYADDMAEELFGHIMANLRSISEEEE